MNERKNLIASAIILFVLGALFIFGCRNTREQTQVQKVAARQEAQPLDPVAQEAFKKKLDGLGIPMYKGAKFIEVKKKTKDSPLLIAVYEVPAQRENDYEKVVSFYTAGLKKALVPKGWVAAQAAGGVILYRKGFEIFYVEFSRIIIPPDTKKIRIAFQYGK